MSAYLSLIGRRRGGRLFEVGRLLIFSPFRMGAFSKWVLIRGWALIRINTVILGLILLAQTVSQNDSNCPYVVQYFSNLQPELQFQQFI